MDRKIALLIEYDGTKYYGFQFQPNFPTIQGEIENALNNLNLSNERIEGAGRTDTGVHAKGQMASFITNSNLDIQDIESGINHFLPSDIAIQKAYEAPINFSPRRDAISRRYRYTFLNRSTRSPLSENDKGAFFSKRHT
jgi:tRNA pseudouridine38-40 synthase